MNRFFSKLDLRDIKISPEGSRFPPDADEQESQSKETVVEQADLVADDDGTTTWESPIFSNGHLVAEEASVDSTIDDVVSTPVVEIATDPAPTRDTSSYAVDGVALGDDGEVLKVSARSRPSAVAGAIAGVVREAGRAEVQAIGAGATNQAVKAVAIAREYLRETGIDAVCVPAFIDVTIENEDRTAIRLVIEPR